MSAFAENTPFTHPGQPEQVDNWRPLGDVIKALKAKVDAAIFARNEEEAAEAHADLIDAEHRQRVIETVRRLSR